MTNKIIDYVKGILVLVLVFMCYLSCSMIETHYTKEVSVSDFKNGIVTFEDSNGHLWEWEDLNFKNENSKYILIMDNNNTDNILTDDIIVKVKVKKEKGD